MPVPKRQLIQTICPLCTTAVTVKRTGALNKMRFDPEQSLARKDFIRVIESMGRAKGFGATRTYTLAQAIADPAFQEYVNRMHASVSQLKDYLDRTNP